MPDEGAARMRDLPGRSAPTLPLALLFALAVGCARQGTPPGGPEDRRPPVIIATSPEPFGVITDLGMSIRFDFDERISERTSNGEIDDAISISPRVGDLQVSHGRRSLSVKAPGGFRPGIVYRVTLQPVVADMFGNQLNDPFELVFSTGGEPTATTLAGEIWDRITGTGIADASVQAVGTDSLVHQSTTGRDGIYAFRYLPGGDFAVQAFEDRNRNHTLDSTEVQGVRPVSVAVNDTVFLDLPILAPDTLPAILRGASALDSVTVVVEMDDFIDPEQPASDIVVTIELEGGPVPAVTRTLHEAEYAELVEAARDSIARADSITRANAPPSADTVPPPVSDSVVGPPDTLVSPPDTLVAPPDTLVAPPDTAVVPPDTALVTPGRNAGAPARPVQRGPSPLTAQNGTRPGVQETTGRLLPARRLVLLLDDPLTPEVEYTVRASGVINLNGLSGGGGETTLVLEPPPPEPDSGAAATGDTIGVDTLAVDTLAVDTLVVDTLAVDNPAVDTLSADGPTVDGGPARTGVAGDTLLRLLLVDPSRRRR